MHPFKPSQQPRQIALTATCLGLLVVLNTSGCQHQVENKVSSTSVSSHDRVTVGKPSKKTLKLYTEQPARVQAFEEAPIVSKLAGYIQEVSVDIGDKVKKDQLLVRLHAPEYQDQHKQKLGLVTQAEALVKQAEAAVVAAEAAATSIKATIAEAEAGIAKAQAEYTRWESESQRIQQLAATGTVTNKLSEETLSQYQGAKANKDEAVAKLASVKAKAAEADANVLKAHSDIDVAKAKLNVAQSELAQAQTMLDYMEIKSPFDGVVTSRSIDVGHFVQPAGSSSAQPLLTIANVEKVRVFVNVPESEAGWIDAGFSDPNLGDAVQLNSPTFTKPVETRVTRTSRQLNPQSRTLSVEIDLENQESRLLPGAFITAKILLEQRQDVIVIPIAAVVKNGEQTICCGVVDGKIEHRPIRLGLRVGDEVEVSEGISENDKIVLTRANSLQPEQTVEVIEKQ